MTEKNPITHATGSCVVRWDGRVENTHESIGGPLSAFEAGQIAVDALADDLEALADE